MRPRSRLFLLSAAMASVIASLSAADASSATESKEYLEQKQELEKMVSSRDLDLYELSAVPLRLDDIVIRDRLGKERAYTYLVFRLRNSVTSLINGLEDEAPRSAELLKSMADPTAPVTKGRQYSHRYAGILKAIGEEYPVAKVTTEDGGRVVVGDEKDPNNVVLKRENLSVRGRSVNLSVTAFDEHGSRIQLLDEPVGSGKQNQFPVDDRGNIRVDANYDQVRERIEDLADRRLRTLREIRGMHLPPYDPAKRDAEGVADGEVFGVAIFERFDLRGNRFTLELRGLCNKTRVVVPPSDGSKPENHLAMRVLRRTMVFHFNRSGDEFYREIDRYELADARYRWIDTFQRLDQRRLMSTGKYFVDQIEDKEGKARSEVEALFWQQYNQFRADRPQAGDRLPDLQAALKVTPGP